MRMSLHSIPCDQRGVALIVSLVLLFTLTLIAVSSMSTSRLEQKMTANMRDRQVAFQSAEAALREGENYVQNNTLAAANFDSSCTNGQCLCTSTMLPSGCTTEYWTDTTLAVWDTNGKHKLYSGTLIGSQPAKYIIEYMGQSCSAATIAASGSCQPTDPFMYRVTAIGYGQTANARVMLQSTYLKK